MDFFIERIISGGQTGADRAALDWAIKENIQHGGWCPRGRLAEDGVISSVYNLSETPSEDYSVRTEWNVRDSDATAIFTKDEVLRGGTQLTKKMALEHHRPTIHVHAGLGIEGAAIRIKKFVHQYSAKVLNVAGPRASEDPDIGTFVTNVLDAAFSQTRKAAER